MDTTYIEYHFTVQPIQPTVDIVIAQLGAIGFESFVETETGVKAYIQKSDWNKDAVTALQVFDVSEFSITFEITEIEQVNWNETWETNFNPITVGTSCVVRAPFHEAYNVPYEIVIEPKMSFGTGHHETTYMMLKHILANDFNDKSVLDMGSGTAVLAILAEMRGATSIDAIDIDTWCYENALENVERNSCKHIQVILGDVEKIKGKQYNTIIANINRNILLQDLAAYNETLSPNGELYLSGFYTEDLPIITDTCNKLGLSFVENFERNNWVAAKFYKK